MAVALACVKTASADPIEAKRAEAQNVLAQIQEIDGQLEQAVEAYNLASLKLERIQGELKTNAHHLVIARKSLKNAQTHLSERLVALYVGGGEGTSLEVLLGARSIDDLLNRLDAVERVSAQDTRVLSEVKSFRTQVRQRAGAAASGRRRSRCRSSPIARPSGSRSRASSPNATGCSPRSRIRSRASRPPSASGRSGSPQRRGPGCRERRCRLRTRPCRSVDACSSQAPPARRSRRAPPSRYGGVVGIAMQYLGVPYVWGGASPSGFDCSGFIMYVYGQVGVSLPHHAASQYGSGSPVSRDALEPGDLVFFNGLGHAGIYIGGGQFIHAPHTGDVVKISSLYDSWYAATWYGARRL